MTKDQLEYADNIIADVQWWFKGFVAAQPRDVIIDIPDMSALRELRDQLRKEAASDQF